MLRRNRHQEPAGGGPDLAQMALEAQRRALENCCAGCCSKDYPCRYHKGYIKGVHEAMLEFLDVTGLANGRTN